MTRCSTTINLPASFVENGKLYLTDGTSWVDKQSRSFTYTTDSSKLEGD
ncbi:MAG: hypothetical protein ACLTDF_11815 [Coprococcus sp.]